MKLKVFTKKQWKKKRIKIMRTSEGNLDVAYSDGYAEGRKLSDAVLSTALYKLWSSVDPTSPLWPVLDIDGAEVGKVEAIVKVRGNIFHIEFVSRQLLPDEVETLQ